MAVKAIDWDRSLQHRLRVTPTRLCNHNNHNNVTSTRNRGQEKQQHPPGWDKGSRRVKCSDVLTGYSTTISTARVCRQVKARMSCFLPQTPHTVTQWAPGTDTTAAQYQLLPLPAASLSWNQLHSWHAGWAAVWDTHLQPGGHSHQWYFHMQLLCLKALLVHLCCGLWMPVQKLLGTMCPNSQINRIHSLCGISFWMAACCTSLCAFGRATGGIKQTNMSAQLESQVVPSAIWITMETARYTISTLVCLQLNMLHVCNCTLGILLHIIKTI